MQALYPDGDKGIWLETWRGLYYFDQAMGRYNNYPSEVLVEYMSQAPSGDIWVGGLRDAIVGNRVLRSPHSSLLML